LTLQDYVTKTYRILRDEGTLYNQGDLISWVNEARRLRDYDTRLVRKVVSFTLVATQSTYDLGTIQAGTMIRGDAAFSNARDIVSVYIIPTGGTAGGTGLRYPLGRQPYSKVSYLCSTSWPSYPTVYGVIGWNTVVLAPPPAIAYAAEWDLVGNYPDLTGLASVDPMPDPYNDPVPYMAAAIAKENMQRFDEAQMFEGTYVKRLNQLGFGVRRFAVANPGSDLPRGVRR
jgi:hypothetical protein